METLGGGATVGDSDSLAAVVVVAGFAGAEPAVGEATTLAASDPDARFGAGAASRTASRTR